MDQRQEQDNSDKESELSRGSRTPRAKDPPVGILRVESWKPRRSSGEFRYLSQIEPTSPQPSVDRLSVTFADDSQRSDLSRKSNAYATSSSPASVMDKVHFTPPSVNCNFHFADSITTHPQTKDEENSDDEDYSVSVTAIMQRRASTKKIKRRNSRRTSSPFSPDILPGTENGRRRSSCYTTSSGETAISVEDNVTPEVTQDQIFENIRLHKEVLSSVKMQPWPMRKKLRLVVTAKNYVKRHEGALQERFAQSHSTKDMLARWNIYLVKRWQRAKREAANLSNWVIPWELRIKEIESHFGSVVASYFTFLRWLFWVNLVTSIILIAFVAVPELLTADQKAAGDRKLILKEDKYNATNFLTLWDFEGILKYSPLFYGWYTNKDIKDKGYRLPLAYFMTGLVVYIYSFVATLRKMAENSRMSKLSEKDDECIFSWKVFTSWDYMIGNPETAANRVASIVMGFKEALLEEAEKRKDKKPWKIVVFRVFVNIAVVILLVLSAYAVILVVKRSTEPEAKDNIWRMNEITIVMTLISTSFPMFFEVLGICEQYHPRKQLRLQLARIMLLNLLNLYSLIIALFDKISEMQKEWAMFMPPNYTNNSLSNPSENFSDCYKFCMEGIPNLQPALLMSLSLILPKIFNTSNYNITSLNLNFNNTFYNYTGIDFGNLTDDDQFYNYTNFDTSTIVYEDFTGFENFTWQANFTDFDENSTTFYQNYTEFDNVTFLENSTEIGYPNENFDGNYSTNGGILDFIEEIYKFLASIDQQTTEDSIASWTEEILTNISRFDTTIAPIDNTTNEMTEKYFSRPTDYPQIENITIYTTMQTFIDTITPIMANISSTISPTNCSLCCKPPPNTVTDTTINISAHLETLDYQNRTKLRSLCWETMFGQELVKLTVMDLVVTIVSTLAMDFFRGVFVRVFNNCWCWDLEKKFPQYGDFKVAENILHLVNNQGMVWMGMFFSPGIVVINVVKLYVMVYFRSWAVLTCNVPHKVVFRASRSNNFYYALLLSMLFLCVLPVGYAIVWVQPSFHCGPFSNYDRIFYIFTKTLRQLLPESVHKSLDYIASPGIVIPLLVLMILIIYYLLSLTDALREANSDLKTQLRRERTEERRKMFQIADRRRRVGSEGSTELANTPFGKWKRLLHSLPSGKSFDETPKQESDDVQQVKQEPPKSKDFFTKLIKRALKKPVVSDEEEGTDTDQHESLPEDISSVKEAKPQVSAKNSFKVKPELNRGFRSIVHTAVVKKDSSEAIQPEPEAKSSTPSTRRRRDSIDLRKSHEKKKLHQSPSTSSKDVRQDSINSNWSDNIPVITISKSESLENVLDREKKLVEIKESFAASSNDTLTNENVDVKQKRHALKKQQVTEDEGVLNNPSEEKIDVDDAEEVDQEEGEYRKKPDQVTINSDTKTESSTDYKDSVLS